MVGVIGAESCALQAGGRRFEPGHVHQNFTSLSPSGLREPHTAERYPAAAWATVHSFVFRLATVAARLIAARLRERPNTVPSADAARAKRQDVRAIRASASQDRV